MNTIVLEKPQLFRMVDLPEPGKPGPGDALVRVHRVGVCGTDISGYLGKMPFFSYPRIPGHELGVEVIAVGDGVQNVQPGDRCSIEPYINCQNCSSCRRGHTNCCENHLTLGVHCDGGLRPYFKIPARKLHISRKLTFDQLALVETLGIGCHAVNRSRVQRGEIVLVIGAGPIGLSVIEFVKIAGAKCLVMDLVPSRLEFCRKIMGVDGTHVAKGDGSDPDEIRALAGGEWPHVVVDATGSNKSMSQALHFCAFAGRVVFLGITSQEISFPHAPMMHRRELSLLASRNAVAPEFKQIIQLIEDGRLDTGPWITHRASFDDLIEKFPSFTKPETGVIKAMVEIA